MSEFMKDLLEAKYIIIGDTKVSDFRNIFVKNNILYISFIGEKPKSCDIKIENPVLKYKNKYIKIYKTKDHYISLGGVFND